MNNALKLTPFQKTISIEYVDGLCGSGKTYALAGRDGPNCLNRHYQFISEYLSFY
jgi:hypothetical protein